LRLQQQFCVLACWKGKRGRPSIRDGCVVDPSDCQERVFIVKRKALDIVARARIKAAMKAFRAFPTLSETTLGGLPLKTLIPTKSSSRVINKSPLSTANILDGDSAFGGQIS